MQDKDKYVFRNIVCDKLITKFSWLCNMIVLLFFSSVFDKTWVFPRKDFGDGADKMTTMILVEGGDDKR